LVLFIAIFGPGVFYRKTGKKVSVPGNVFMTGHVLYIIYEDIKNKTELKNSVRDSSVN
jgi:hypothetical protein